MTPLAPGDEPGSPADSLPPRPQTTGRRRAVDDDDDASFAQDEDQENDRRMLKALATKRAESAKASGAGVKLITINFPHNPTGAWLR